MKQKPDFATIKNIKERQLAFLKFTVGFYNSNNRAERPHVDTASDDNCTCVYFPLKNSPGCAIGQHCPNAKELSGAARNCFDKLPDWMQEMGVEFLDEIQRLHDFGRNWDANGMSTDGARRYLFIQRLIESGQWGESYD